MASIRSRGPQSWRQARLLLVARIPDRPAADRCPDQHGPAGAVQDGARGSRHRSRRIARNRTRRRARQRRIGPACRMLHGKSGDAGDPRTGLRYSLRARAVLPDRFRRMAAGVSGTMAALREPLGIRTQRCGVRYPVWRASRTNGTDGQTISNALDSRRDHPGRCLRYADRRLARSPRQRATALVRARSRPDAPRHLQQRRPSWRDVRDGAGAGDLEILVPERRNTCGP